MRILGVDPGIRNTGWCVLDEGKIVARGVIRPPGRASKRGKLLVGEVLAWVLPILRTVLEKWQPLVVSVEEVTWFGKSRRVTLPLSHVSGGIAGFVLAFPFVARVYLLNANQKRGKIRCRGAGWSEHEKDAASLAKTILDFETAQAVGVPSFRKTWGAVARRAITVARRAHGSD